MLYTRSKIISRLVLEKILKSMAAILGHMTRTIWTYFRSPILLKVHMKFGFNGPAVPEMSEECRQQMDDEWWMTDGWTDGWMDDAACLYYSHTNGWANKYGIKIKMILLMHCLQFNWVILQLSWPNVNLRWSLIITHSGIVHSHVEMCMCRAFWYVKLSPVKCLRPHYATHFTASIRQYIV